MNLHKNICTLGRTQYVYAYMGFWGMCKIIVIITLCSVTFFQSIVYLVDLFMTVRSTI